MDVLHTALWVTDIHETLAFYCDGIGLKKTRERLGDDNVVNYFVGGMDGTEIQFKYDGSDREVDPDGIDHVAVSVDDVDETVATLVDEYGSEITRGPNTIEDLDLRAAFVTDPDGYGVELVRYF